LPSGTAPGPLIKVRSFISLCREVILSANRLAAILGVGAILATLLSLGPSGSRAAEPRFEPAPCPVLPPLKAMSGASCGYLVVPENRNRPNGRTIRLMVTKFPATSAERQADPVVYVAGGPGDVAPWEVSSLVAADFIHDRDLVVMSQRGTYFSKPPLTCAPADDFDRRLLGLRFYSAATERAHIAATRACRDALAATGADLAAYNSTESAADFADLRRTLGYAAWNVYGTSYGSFLAQVIMRDHPEGIRSAILDSVLPMTYTVPSFWDSTRNGFANLFAACAAEAACAAKYPGLEQTFTGLVNKLEAEPLTAIIKDPVTGKDLEVMLDGGALVDWLRNQSTTTPTFRTMPALISGLAAGRPGVIEAIAKDRTMRAPPSDPRVPSLGYGLALGVSCRELNPFATSKDLVAAGRAAFPDYPSSVQHEAVGSWAYTNQDCAEVWKVPAAPPALRRPVASHIPTLLLSGSFDSLTSLAGAKAVAAGLSNPTVISIPGVGHFVAPSSPCAQRVVVSFLAKPEHPPDASCLKGLMPPSFATTGP